ncbi:MAG: DUF982 domain-containing protein [Rhizobiaceae bacterium]|nr:DUF982 domain-containing protein [Rhizobiaceae bacterium]
MATGKFSPMVSIRMGQDTIREADSIRDVDEIMLDWPQARRGDFYRRVRECVEAAKRGDASPAELREVFVAFAEHAQVLVAR